MYIYIYIYIYNKCLTTLCSEDKRSSDRSTEWLFREAERGREDKPDYAEDAQRLQNSRRFYTRSVISMSRC